MFVFSLYLLGVMAFYALPMLFFTVIVLIAALVYSIALLPFTALLGGILTAPLGMGVVYFHAWKESMEDFAARRGKDWAQGVAAITFATWVGLFLWFQQQPQNQAFELLKTPPKTEQARQALVKKSEVIRQGLLNAYLAQYRYPWFGDTHIRDIYTSIFGGAMQPQAEGIQDAFNTWTAPFRYYGEREDSQKAEKLYAEFFDTPILRGELPIIQHAVQSTFMRWEAKAGLLDINEQRVLLTKQELQIKPQGSWAEVELHEVYQNQTYEQQEILYFFSLPESAVVTGVWLGETGDRTKRYVYTVSPRGAAQQVYNQEVQRRVDPALLEQVGPRTYRLRVFPILPKGQGDMHLWLTYKVLGQPEGWPLPQLHERRNVYWSKRTQRWINGKPISFGKHWLPKTLAAPGFKGASTLVAQLDAMQVQAQPIPENQLVLPKDKRLALLVDGSYSMNAHRQALAEAMVWFRQNGLSQNQADLYVTATTGGEPRLLSRVQDFDPKQATFYGTMQPAQMLEQFLSLKGDRTYDAVVLITDSGSYELTEDREQVLAMPAPLWMVHLGGLQPAYDDATLQAIQDSGGSVATSLKEVMQRIGTLAAAPKAWVNVADRYAWSIAPAKVTAVANDAGFAPLAARQWITHRSRQLRSNSAADLDQVHAIAKRYGVVSPYSSMIVLVNDRQRQSLKLAEQGDDRFKREIEDQQLPQPSSVTNPVAAVPEPAEWLLIAASGLVLIGVFWYRQWRDALPCEVQDAD
jgi:putative PEP-CTERM system integral membrane protein